MEGGGGVKIIEDKHARFTGELEGEIKPVWWFVWQLQKMPALLIHELFHAIVALIFVPFGCKLWFFNVTMKVHVDTVEAHGNVGTDTDEHNWQGAVVAFAPVIGYLICIYLFALYGYWVWWVYFQVNWIWGPLPLSESDVAVIKRCLTPQIPLANEGRN